MSFSEMAAMLRALRESERSFRGLGAFPKRSAVAGRSRVRSHFRLLSSATCLEEPPGAGTALAVGPLVSVIIPTFNRAYCLGETLQSVLSQTWSDFEVLVIDDGSTDETRELVESYVVADPRVRYLSQTNQGVSSARNFGLENAQGEYVAMLDSDDLWLPWKLEAQVGVLESLPELCLVWSEMSAIDPSGEVTYPRYLRRMYCGYEYWETERLFPTVYPLQEIVRNTPAEVGNAAVQIGYIFSEMLGGNLVHTSTVMIRREFIKQAGGYNPLLKGVGEDYDFHLRLCRLGPVALMDVPTTLYRRGLGDHLACDKHKISASINYLRTILPVLEKHFDQVTLSRQEVKRILRDGFNWAGEMALDTGMRPLGRLLLWESLEISFRQPRTLFLWIMSHFPVFIERMVRGGYRRVKGVLKRDGKGKTK